VTPQQLFDRAERTAMVPVTPEDRTELGVALILQGYAPSRAANMVKQMEPNDGALQMLARHRIRYSAEAPAS
jgi:hypothetical protein